MGSHGDTKKEALIIRFPETAIHLLFISLFISDAVFVIDVFSRSPPINYHHTKTKEEHFSKAYTVQSVYKHFISVGLF